MTQRLAIIHSLIVLLLSLTFDVLFSHPTAPDDEGEWPDPRWLGFDLPDRVGGLNRRRRSGDQTSDFLSMDIDSYVTSFTNISELQAAKSEFFFVESQPGESKKLKNVFHENFASLNITGSYQYVTPNLADNVALQVSNSTYANLSTIEKTMFDMLIIFRNIYFELSTDSDAFQPIIDLGAQSTDVADTSIQGYFIVQRIELTSGTACSCGWVELERKMANSFSTRAVNLFTYQTYDLEAAQQCKADAIDASNSQDNTSSSFFSEESLSRLIMYSSLGIGGIIFLIGLFSLVYKLCDIKSERGRLANQQQYEMARLQLLHHPRDKKLMSSTSGLNEADLESSKQDESRRSPGGTLLHLPSHTGIQTKEEKEMMKLRRISKYVTSPSGVMGEALGPTNRFVIMDVAMNPPIEDGEKPAKEPSPIIDVEKPAKKPFFSFFRWGKKKKELKQTTDDQKPKAGDKLGKQRTDLKPFALPSTSSSSDSKDDYKRGKSKRSLDELFGKNKKLGESEDVTSSSTVTDSSESESEQSQTTTGSGSGSESESEETTTDSESDS